MLHGTRVRLTGEKGARTRDVCSKHRRPRLGRTLTKLRNIPTRLATGAFVLHSGLERWSGGPEQAQGVHGDGRRSLSGARGPQADRLPEDPLRGRDRDRRGAPGARRTTRCRRSRADRVLRIPAGDVCGHRPCTSRAASGPPSRASASARTCGCSASGSACWPGRCRTAGPSTGGPGPGYAPVRTSRSRGQSSSSEACRTRPGTSSRSTHRVRSASHVKPPGSTGSTGRAASAST